jgi:hypothetical protein
MDTADIPAAGDRPSTPLAVAAAKIRARAEIAHQVRGELGFTTCTA